MIVSKGCLVHRQEVTYCVCMCRYTITGIHMLYYTPSVETAMPESIPVFTIALEMKTVQICTYTCMTVHNVHVHLRVAQLKGKQGYYALRTQRACIG